MFLHLSNFLMGSTIAQAAKSWRAGEHVAMFILDGLAGSEGTEYI
jgi:hypothetical protein